MVAVAKQLAPEELHEQLLRKSCAYFAAEMLSGPPEAPYNGHFILGHHHEQWDELVRKYDRLCVLAPRDHGKSFFFSFAYVIWKAYYEPNQKIYIFSATQEQANKLLEDVKNEIEGNEKLHHLIPNKMGKWSVKYIKLANGVRIYAKGFGTKVRGAHPRYIICDDVLNDESAYSEATRRKQNDYYFSALTNMVVPGGQIIVVGTPFHSKDLYGQLKDNKRYCFRKFPALNKAGEALWPERYTAKYLLTDKKLEIGEIRFTREQLCEPIADDMSLFPSTLFHVEGIEMPGVCLGMSRDWWEERGIVEVFMSVDIAISAAPTGDYFVIWVVGLDKFKNRWILEIDRVRGGAYQSQLSMIVKYAKRYKPGLIHIESNAMQRIWGDELIRTTDLPIRKFNTTEAKHNLEKGVPSLRPLLENGKYRIPRGDARSVDLTETWIEEMRAITFVDGKIVTIAEHDDTVMACWMCEQAILMGAFSFSFEEQAGDEEAFDEVHSIEDDEEEIDLLGINEAKKLPGVPIPKPGQSMPKLPKRTFHGPMAEHFSNMNNGESAAEKAKVASLIDDEVEGEKPAWSINSWN